MYLVPNNTIPFFQKNDEVKVICGTYKDHVSKIIEIEEQKNNRIYFGNFRYKLKNIKGWIPEAYLERAL